MFPKFILRIKFNNYQYGQIVRSASLKTFFSSQSNLSETGKLRTCSKITRPNLGLIRDGGGFQCSLDFFTRSFRAYVRTASPNLLRFWVNRNKVELMNEVNNPKMKTYFILKLKNKVKFHTIVIISC